MDENPTKIVCQNPTREITKTKENIWFAKRPKSAEMASILREKLIGQYDVKQLYKPLSYFSHNFSSNF